MTKDKAQIEQQLKDKVDKADQQLANYDARTAHIHSEQDSENRSILQEIKKNAQVDHLEEKLDTKPKSNKGRNPVL